MDDFTGLCGFIVMDVRKAGSGKKLVHRSVDACLSAVGERVQPDAAPTSPYPRYCPYNPYTVGSVMGIQKGWAANVFESNGLRPFRLPNVHLLLGDGMLGFADGAPYAAIIAAAGGEAIPQAWIDQLAEGGRLVAPALIGPGQQRLIVIDKTAAGPRQQVLEPVLFVPLKSGVS